VKYRYSSTLSYNLSARWGGWSTPRPSRFTPGKETQYPLYRRLGGYQGQSGWVQKILSPLGFDPQIVQPVAGRYTDCAIPPHSLIYTHINNMHCCVMARAVSHQPLKPRSDPGPVHWDLWYMKWQCNRYLFQYCIIPLSVSLNNHNN